MGRGSANSPKAELKEIETGGSTSGDWELQPVRAGVPAGLGRCWAGRLGGGVRSIYDFDGKTTGKRAQVLIFSPFLPSCTSSPSSDVLAFSCWLCLFDLGGQAGGIGAAGGVSVWPGCWACRASPAAWGRAGRSRAVSAGRLPCWPCWGSLCGRWGWCWAWAAVSGQPAC